MERCKDCWLNLTPAYENRAHECAYWGFPLYSGQRACKQYEHRLGETITECKYRAYPLGYAMISTAFPKQLLTVHDYSNKRHKLIIDTACVNGIWYAGVHYGRQYDSCYGSAHSCSIYDGDFATEREAINARLRELLKDETYYKCDEACEFLRGLIMDTRQLSLF